MNKSAIVIVHHVLFSVQALVSTLNITEAQDWTIAQRDHFTVTLNSYLEAGRGTQILYNVAVHECGHP